MCVLVFSAELWSFVNCNVNNVMLIVPVLMSCCDVCRLKLEALTDKDPGELKMAAEEELEDKECQDGAEGPHPAMGQILLDEEEEMIIEQFDSD